MVKRLSKESIKKVIESEKVKTIISYLTFLIKMFSLLKVSNTMKMGKKGLKESFN